MLPASLTLLQMHYLQLKGEPFNLAICRELWIYAHSRRIYTLKDLTSEKGLWVDPAEVATKIRSSRQVGKDWSL
jgi:hypothetical protein